MLPRALRHWGHAVLPRRAHLSHSPLLRSFANPSPSPLQASPASCRSSCARGRRSRRTSRRCGRWGAAGATLSSRCELRCAGKSPRRCCAALLPTASTGRNRPRVPTPYTTPCRLLHPHSRQPGSCETAVPSLPMLRYCSSALPGAPSPSISVAAATAIATSILRQPPSLFTCRHLLSATP